jgi:hypothetical protein
MTKIEFLERINSKRFKTKHLAEQQEAMDTGMDRYRAFSRGRPCAHRVKDSQLGQISGGTMDRCADCSQTLFRGKVN